MTGERVFPRKGRVEVLQSGSLAEDIRPSPIAMLHPGRLVAHRPRLAARLDAAVRTSPVVIVQAEAGSGKTTLAAGWASRLGTRVGVRWQNLRQGRSAVAILDERVGQGTANLRVIVLDDVPVTQDDRLDDGLERLLLRAGPGVSLVLLSCGTPALDLQRLGVGAECQTIDSEELAMNGDEIAHLLSRLGIDPAPGVVSAIRNRTDGWAWGVRLAAARLTRAAPVTDALRETDRVIAGYLENSILRGISTDERGLLTQTSMVGDVSAEHVARIVGDDRPLPADLAGRTRGFVRVRADGSFVAHPVLRRHLLRQLRRSPAAARTATREAVRCAVDRGDLVTAVDVAVHAGDWACAAEMLVESLQIPRLLAGGHAVSESDDVDDGLAVADPVLKAAIALGRSWPDVAATALGMVAAPADPGPGTGHANCSRSIAEQLSRDLVAMALARWEGAAAAGLLAHHRAAALLPKLSVTQRTATPELAPLMQAHLAAFELASGAPDRAKVALERGARAFRAKPTAATNLATQIAAADCLGQLAWLEALNGDLTSALHRAADVLTARPADSNEVGVVYAQLASVWCEISRMELEPAVQRFDSLTARRSAPADGAVLPELAVAAALTAARVTAVVGHRRIGYEVRQLCQSSPNARRLEQQLRLIQAEAELDVGEPAAALRLLGEAGHLNADVYVLRARAWIQLGDRASVAASLRVRPVESLSLLTQVQLELIEAWLAQAHGDRTRLWSLVDRALRTVQREQLRGPISWAKPWLHDVVTGHHVLLRRYGPFLASIRRNQFWPAENASRSTSANALTSALTERELDILQRLGALSTNEEIAADLFLSPNTIKTHLRSLYRKLDVTRRSEAFRRGRALGLC